MILADYIKKLLGKTSKRTDKPKEIVLFMSHINNPQIADAFIEAFTDAITKSTIHAEVQSGEIKIRWKIDDVWFTKEMKQKFIDAGYEMAKVK